MNLSTASRTFQLLSRILDVRSTTEAFLPTAREKPPLPLRSAQQPFPRATPESQGISSLHIRNFLEELNRGGDLHMQNALILRNGQVLCEAAFGAQDLRAPKYTFSACKSVTSLAVGLLMDDGALSPEDKVADLFDDLMTPTIRRRLRDMTLEDLLTMRAGVLFSEAEALTESDWLRRFFNSTLKNEPGTEFFYNSLNTYMLSAIVFRKSGKCMSSFLEERLFGPMGITDCHWEQCPMGIEKGGWGLYIRPEDMAKLGQLVMDGGMWKGQRLISREYIDRAVSPHAFPPEAIGDFNYGYQIWVGRKENTFLFNGMLGQNVLGFRDSGVLIVTNAGADTDFQESRYFEIVSRYFGGAFPPSLQEDEAGRAALLETVRDLSHYSRVPGRLDDRAAPFLDHAYASRDDRAASVGLLPLAIQALHNNYTSGVVSVAVSVRGDLPELIYRERDAVYRFPVGLGTPAVSQLDFRGNVFQVAATGRFTSDEEDRPVFFVRLDFLETPCVRILKLVLTEEGPVLKQTETPGVPYVYRKLLGAAEQPLYKPLLLVAAGGTDGDYLYFKTLQVLSPELRMARIDRWAP